MDYLVWGLIRAKLWIKCQGFCDIWDIVRLRNSAGWLRGGEVGWIGRWWMGEREGVDRGKGEGVDRGGGGGEVEKPVKG